MARIIDFAAPLGQKAAPGQWNDLDMRKSVPDYLSLKDLIERPSPDWVGLFTCLASSQHRCF